ncbi:hypothetical protein U732_4303 [Clostridium argentinense CDC 2741]|uniref:Uncharacterized protein n=1 Tax=Clostridium argentinense CDC 2741 TaxID=1418104 RepID=A0A0C1UA21_9CLOT|nr:hypothetical protein [Clostridium argentinense]ARC84764.1 hypothetical protein RSJ17_09620 [Clostridium argentinense]KIE48523.1 hypothetical protein U732_4303 [Clostridium argentinense CDC 2741]NFF41804.1 hypothetical protein [Clostridium argentinense]NFP52467.1 hypothetical protein [Clostridium argentinense]NFP74801.1 hypothetical protein [Clostridium argentinense]
MKNSKRYLEKINKYILELDNEKEKLEVEIKKEKQLIDEKQELYKKLDEKGNDLKGKYELLKNFLINRGLIFEVENKYDLTQWDNLYLERLSSNYAIKNKKGDTIKFIEEDINDIFDEILNGNISVSILVIRENIKTVTIQLRFIKNE